MFAKSQLAVRLLRHEELEPAARLAAAGMSDNPLNICVFRGAGVQQRTVRMRRFFVPVLEGLHRRGFVLGAFHSDRLVGVCGVARPGFCQPSLAEKTRVLPAALAGNAPDLPLRIIKWVSEWDRRDPPIPHWHPGPIAVDPVLRHQGIGSALMSACCDVADSFGAPSYLETDKPENVRFYERFGYRVTESAEVLGVPNWFMLREPGS